MTVVWEITVKNYLDGVHLNVLAMNGDDGKIYLYRASAEDFSESEKLHPAHERLVLEKKELEEEAKQTGRSGNHKKKDKLWHAIWDEHNPKIKAVGYDQKRKEEVDRIFSRPEIYQNIEELPPVNYRVNLIPIPITSIEKELFWADEITITSLQEDNVIAYSKRYMSYGWWLGFAPPNAFSGGFQRGDVQAYEFDDKVLFEYAKTRGSQWTRNTFQKSSHNRAAMRWRRDSKNKKKMGDKKCSKIQQI